MGLVLGGWVSAARVAAGPGDGSSSAVAPMTDTDIEVSTTTTTASSTIPGHDDGPGSPTRIVFEVRWELPDGSPIVDLETLPGSWRDSFVVTGHGATGNGEPTSATCTYPSTGADLACTYANPGHEAGTGLVLAARPTATYQVAVDGSPDGWQPDGSTVGTFVGFDTCPPGGGVPFCTHTVRMLQGSTPTTTTPAGHGGGQGNPTRILFEVRWEQHDGTLLGPPSAPAGWRSSFVVVGASTTGSGMPTSATCVYAPAGAELICTYENPGHPDGVGLVVRARATATYDVTVSGAPEGWPVDPSTVGTFVGGDTCPRGTGSGGSGGGHTDGDGHTGGGGGDGHTDGGGGGGGGGGGEGSVVCTHTVRLIRQPTSSTVAPTTTAAGSSTTPTTEPATTEPATTEPSTTDVASATPTTIMPTSVAGTGSEVRSSGSGLPTTGSAAVPLSLVALLCLLTGSALLHLRRAGTASDDVRRHGTRPDAGT